MVEGKHVGYIGKPKTEFPNILLVLIRLQRKKKLLSEKLIDDKLVI